MLQTTASRTRRQKNTLTSEAQFTNQKDLTPGQKIAQTSTQKAVFPSPVSTQFPITESNLMIKMT